MLLNIIPLTSLKYSFLLWQTKELQTTMYTMDCDANRYDKVIANKNSEYIYKIKLNKNTNLKLTTHRLIKVCTDKKQTE